MNILSRRKKIVKFHCENCGGDFRESEIKIFTERHGFNSPPYEKFPVCPYCNSTNFEGVKEDA